MSRKRRAAARVSPVARATSDSVQLRVLGVERADDREAALERLHEVRAVRAQPSRPSSRSTRSAMAKAVLAAGTPA